MLDVLRMRETPVRELVDGLAMSPPSVSRHLRTLHFTRTYRHPVDRV
jgi:DNA-binding transcriptional ArsR family regulator